MLPIRWPQPEGHCVQYSCSRPRILTEAWAGEENICFFTKVMERLGDLRHPLVVSVALVLLRLGSEVGKLGSL